MCDLLAMTSFQLLRAVEKQPKAAFRPTKIVDKPSFLTDKDIIHEVIGNSVDVSPDEDDMEVSEVKSIRKQLIEEARRATGI